MKGIRMRQIAKLSSKKKMFEDASQTNSFNNHIFSTFQTFLSPESDVKMTISITEQNKKIWIKDEMFHCFLNHYISIGGGGGVIF